jgi:type IV pilus assembly protein PilE
MAISSSGSSLFEVIVTLVIVAILATVGYPSFSHYLLHSRRSTAQNQLLALQLRQEEYRLAHGNYSMDLQQLGLTPSEEYDYQLQLTPSGYQLTATPSASSGQQQDAGCQRLSLDQNRQRRPIACW